MAEREATVSIAAPPAAVFDYLSDLTRHPEWAADPLTITHKSGAQRGAGAVYSCSSPSLGGVQGEVTVEVAEPPRLVFLTRDNRGEYRWTILAEPEGAGTKLTYGMDVVKMPALMKIIFDLIIGPTVVKSGIRKTAASIKQHAEAAAKTAA